MNVTKMKITEVWQLPCKILIFKMERRQLIIIAKGQTYLDYVSFSHCLEVDSMQLSIEAVGLQCTKNTLRFCANKLWTAVLLTFLM
jgi:hypothetical protein